MECVPDLDKVLGENREMGMAVIGRESVKNREDRTRGRILDRNHEAVE
jgi:hypothetical protein